jgi:hypothetical protein
MLLGAIDTPGSWRYKSPYPRPIPPGPQPVGKGAKPNTMLPGMALGYPRGPEDMLLFLCVHGGKHQWTRLAWICDVAEFIREAQEEGLHVILRPGPYICAEWDLGGLPSWLLADPNIVLRSDDPKFMQPVGSWLKRLGQELASLQATRGGPIFAVQVENEYGSFDSDKVYMRHIYDLIAAAGLGEVDVLLRGHEDNAGLWLERAMLLHACGHDAEAAEAKRRAIQLRPALASVADRLPNPAR